MDAKTAFPSSDCYQCIQLIYADQIMTRGICQKIADGANDEDLDEEYEDLMNTRLKLRVHRLTCKNSGSSGSGSGGTKKKMNLTGFF